MRLTTYGRRFFVRTSAIMALAVLIAGATIMELDAAHVLSISQQLFNMLFIALILPLCVCAVAKWCYDEIDRRNERRIQSMGQG